MENMIFGLDYFLHLGGRGKISTNCTEFADNSNKPLYLKLLPDLEP